MKYEILYQEIEGSGSSYNVNDNPDATAVTLNLTLKRIFIVPISSFVTGEMDTLIHMLNCFHLYTTYNSMLDVIAKRYIASEWLLKQGIRFCTI